jgi:hypothetical protein
MTRFLTHTPLYVWAILALLVYRGLVALRDRELHVRSLFIIPLVMLALSIHDIGAKFGLRGFAPALWTLGALAASLLAWAVGDPRVSQGSAPGRVRVAGSRLPLAMMMAVFATKYAASAALAVLPQLAEDALFVTAVCVAYGACNGCFLGRLAGDLRSCRAAAA